MAYRVLSYVHDESAGVYRIIIGNEVLDEVIDPDTEEAKTVVVRHDDVRDIVFADDDPQWFDNGKRRDDHEVVEAQLKIIRDQVKKQTRTRKSKGKAPRKMPGENLKI
jgi:hypothetical protein